MGSDLTAAQLAEIVGPVRDLLPDGALSSPFAEEVCEAVLTRWLIGEGYHSFDWAYNSDMERVELSLYDDEPYWGKTQLQALVSAVVAARTEKK